MLMVFHSVKHLTIVDRYHVVEDSADIVSIEAVLDVEEAAAIYLEADIYDERLEDYLAERYKRQYSRAEHNTPYC
jgi:hypothetical protein